MIHASSAEDTPFTPIFSEPEVGAANGSSTIPSAQVFFPDASTAVSFINAAIDERYGMPLSLADFRTFQVDAPLGKQSEYDCTVHFDPKTNGVVLTLENRAMRTPEAHSRLRSFVLETIGVVVGDRERQTA